MPKNFAILVIRALAPGARAGFAAGPVLVLELRFLVALVGWSNLLLAVGLIMTKTPTRAAPPTTMATDRGPYFG